MLHDRSPAESSPGTTVARPSRSGRAREQQAEPPPSLLARLRAVLAGQDGITWLIAAAVTTAYTVISVTRYVRRAATSWDLGIFTEYVKQFAHLRAPIVDIRAPGLDLLGDHFHPIVALIAPFFRIFPTPVTLLVSQAVLAGIAVFPVSKAARELLGPAAGRSIAAAFGFSWGLQQMANYDFHEIAFAVPLMAFAMSAIVRGRVRAAVLWAMPLVFVKEDQGFTLFVLGLVLAFAYRHRAAGLFVAGWGLMWSLLAIFVIIPHFNPQHTYPYWGLSSASPVGGHFSPAGLWDALTAGSATKLPTLALILLPTAFIALGSPLVLAALPSLTLRFLAGNPNYWGTQWHYNATVMSIVFIAAIDSMVRARARGQARSARPMARTAPRQARLSFAAGQYGAAAMIAICAALAFQFPISSLWTPSTYQTGPHVTAVNKAMALVPPGATVATDLDELAPLAAAHDTFWLGNYGSNPPTQYVVFDALDTWTAPPPNALAYVEGLIPHARYQQIFADNDVYVFRRVG